MNRRQLLLTPSALLAAPSSPKVAVLTFDDSVRSHLEFAAPLVRELGFGATFFATHRWMNDRANFLDWREIAELHRMGFEIGNHTWTHLGLASPRGASRLAGELALVENELRKVGVPKPVSFAWPGNAFGPEALAILEASGFRYARRGVTPEAEYGKMQVSAAYEPDRHHPLLIPTTADSYPDWTFEHFEKVLERAGAGRIVVLQFHGLPDKAHPWVHTPPEMFRSYMERLRRDGFRVIAMRDLEAWIDRRNLPRDPLLARRVPEPKDGRPALPVEVEATRRDLPRWNRIMAAHSFAPDETARVAGGPVTLPAPPPRASVLPYPGGRHTRIGFLEGAIDPMRGSKASVFLPWDPSHFVVVDVPEAIFCNLGLLFLAHTHIPTVWDDRNEIISNVDWSISERDGGLTSEWTLPNGVAFGASVRGAAPQVEMELWLRNALSEPLRGLRTQVCALFRGAPEFAAQTNENKVYRDGFAAVRSASGSRWIITAWERAGRVWGNPQCPCMHSDPVLPDCEPGQTVRVRGWLWFEETAAIDPKLIELKQRFLTPGDISPARLR